MIRVCFFAELRERLNCSQLEMDSVNGRDVNSLLTELLTLYPHWQSIFLEKKWLVAVNQTMGNLHTPVNDNDEVAFFPPVTGG